ncbi:MAG: thioredoxin family protein [Candidatus Lokiarchaeota archaeon]|nr:thioredoxin family protein [Candidatus Lokiarchaeota archaeon]
MINIKFDLKNLKWGDLVSPTMKPDNYLKEYGEKIALNYKTYEPKLDILEKISKLLNEKKEKLKIVALGADWCPDCTRNVPRMIKIMKLMKNKDENFQILYSPPEAVKTHFNLKRLPTFYFFNESGDLLGIIVENPKNSSTLEEDLLEILEDKL